MNNSYRSGGYEVGPPPEQKKYLLSPFELFLLTGKIPTGEINLQEGEFREIEETEGREAEKR